MADDDAALVRRVLAGEKELYRKLVEKFLGAVTSVSYASVSDREEARDIAQETFCDAFAQLHSLRDPERFGAWVVGIARNKSVYWLRRKKRERSVRAPRPPRSVGPDERIETAEDCARAIAALMSLPEKYRQVLVLRLLEDRAHDEIASLLSISLSAVDKRLTRAKEMLRRKLGGGEI